MPPRKQPTPLEPLRSHNVVFTRKEEDALYALRQQCRDRLGRGVSAAAVIRALIQAADAERIPLDTLTDALEREMHAGRRWGLVPRKKPA